MTAEHDETRRILAMSNAQSQWRETYCHAMPTPPASWVRPQDPAEQSTEATVVEIELEPTT